MAFTERYVADDAAGGGDGTVGDPWTLAEAFSTAAAGDRVNILDGSYSTGTASLSNAGTSASAIVYRGYTSTIGDLTGERTPGGNLITTDYPVITVSGTITPQPWVVFESLRFTASFAGYIISSTSIDNVAWINCSAVNSANSGSAGTFQSDNGATFLNCDLSCTGSSHNNVVDCDAEATCIGCMFVGDNNSKLSMNDGLVERCAFYGDNVGIQVNNWAAPTLILNNTFNDLTNCITLPNTAPSARILVLQNHATACDRLVLSNYSGTADAPVILIHNRTRAITSANTGVGNWPDFGAVTATGGKGATDYFDEPNGDFRLVPGAPGISASLVGGHLDIGALQHRDPYHPRARRH